MENKANQMTAPANPAEAVKNAMAKATKNGTLAGLKHTDIQTVFGGMKAQIAQALPRHLTADRMIQMACSLITKNPKIAECSAASLMGAVMQASILGFRPVDTLGECYFVPYGGSVQFQIGYKGYISLARRTNELKMLYAEVVREGDDFTVEYGLNPILKHVPAIENEDARVTHVYAVAHYKDGGYNFVVMTYNQVERLRKRNPMQKGSPAGAWATDWEAMAKAKAIKQLSKYLPLSVDMQNAIVSDEAVISEKAFSNDRSGMKIEGFSYEFEDAQATDITSEPAGANPDVPVNDLFDKKPAGPSPVDEMLMEEAAKEKKGVK